MLKRLIILMLGTMFCTGIFSQQTKEDIQKKQQELQKELADLNNTLSEIKKNKKQSLGQLALVQRKIRARQELITSISKQLNNIDDDINANTQQVSILKAELDTLKNSYAKSLVIAYKNRGNYDYLNFIFSAGSFNDAIKRIAYLKSYRTYRETQVSNIIKTQQLLQQKLNSLTNNKLEKNNTLLEQGKQLNNLEADQKEQADVVQQLKSKEKDVAAEIKNNEKLRQKLQQNLQVIIRREIAAAKEKEKQRQLAKQQEEERQRKLEQQNQQNNTASNNQSAKPPENTVANANTPASLNRNRSYNPLESTPEGLTQSLNFENNRGKLPWPVSSGNISSPFGTHSIPGTKLMEDNDGINMSVPVGASVKAVADGEVTSIFDLGGQQAVVVRHGKYFTSYSNLQSVNVSRGDKVSAGTVLGKAAANNNGEGEIIFEIMDDKYKFYDPENWLRSR